MTDDEIEKQEQEIKIGINKQINYFMKRERKHSREGGYK